MTTHRGGRCRLPPARGAGLAVLSATVRTVRTVRRGLLDAGWSRRCGGHRPGRDRGAVLVSRRGGLAARPVGLLRRNAGAGRGYGVIAVAGCQLFFFNAVVRMQVGRRAADRVHRPGRRGRLALAAARPAPRVATLAGAAVAALGLVLVLDLPRRRRRPARRALGAAAAGAATYFVISADDARAAAVGAGRGRPPRRAALLVAGLVGLPGCTDDPSAAFAGTPPAGSRSPLSGGGRRDRVPRPASAPRGGSGRSWHPSSALTR